jgi:uncharacterized membrane protein
MSQEREPRERTLELDRLVNFSDAVFAIAATVLVLSVNIPLDLKEPDLDRKIWEGFRDALPSVFAYFVSFFIIGRTWVAHHRMFRIIRRIDGRFIGLNLLLLAVIALLPFPTEVFGTYNTSRPAVIVYAASISLAGLTSTLLYWYATKDNRLIDPSTDQQWVHHSLLRALSVPMVFLTSIPIALIGVTAAQLWWLWMIPLRHYFARRYGKITDIWT